MEYLKRNMSIAPYEAYAFMLYTAEVIIGLWLFYGPSKLGLFDGLP